MSTDQQTNISGIAESS